MFFLLDTYEKAVRKAERIVKSDVETSDVEISKLRRRKCQLTTIEPGTSGDATLSSRIVQVEVSSQSDSHAYLNLNEQPEDFESGASASILEPVADENHFESVPQPLVLVDDNKLEDLRSELRGI